jgi:hypothetical protein
MVQRSQKLALPKPIVFGLKGRAKLRSSTTVVHFEMLTISASHRHNLY